MLDPSATSRKCRAYALLMCVLMALGRLEIFAIVVLFSRSFWQRS